MTLARRKRKRGVSTTDFVFLDLCDSLVLMRRWRYFSSSGNYYFTDLIISPAAVEDIYTLTSKDFHTLTLILYSVGLHQQAGAEELVRDECMCLLFLIPNARNVYLIGNTYLTQTYLFQSIFIFKRKKFEECTKCAVFSLTPESSPDLLLHEARDEIPTPDTYLA